MRHAAVTIRNCCLCSWEYGQGWNMEQITSRDWTSPASAADWQNARTQAEHGDAQAQFALALSYSTGNGHPQDLAQGVKWYRLAATQNHALAQFNLGLMLAAGEGEPRDDAAAMGWIRRAAESGDAGAQFYLGKHCHRASFDRQAANPGELRIESYKWFSLAAVQGYGDSVAFCNRLTINMSRTEVAQANERVEHYSPTQTTAAGA
jgi:uncharacterized protein